MGQGRGAPPGVFVKERVSFNIARLKKGGENFEIVLTDPDLALDFQHGKKIDVNNILESDKIFKDVKKGELQSPENMKKWLGTDNVLEAANEILKQGYIVLTQEQKRKMTEEKRKKIVNYIHTNASDPKTGIPHPITRIELAMDEVKIKIDQTKSVEAQIEEIIKELRTVLPLNFEKARMKVTIPVQFAGSAYGNLKNKYKLEKEIWNDDGSISFELEIAAGTKSDFISLINRLTSGEAIVEEVKK